jgi:hypothetical protein
MKHDEAGRHVVEWILAAKQNITAATIRNVWHKMGFSYFLD